jgi:hypothetical protein
MSMTRPASAVHAASRLLRRAGSLAPRPEAESDGRAGEGEDAGAGVLPGDRERPERQVVGERGGSAEDQRALSETPARHERPLTPASLHRIRATL